MLDDTDDFVDTEVLDPSPRDGYLTPRQRALQAHDETKKAERRAKLLALGVSPERAEAGCQSTADYVMAREFHAPR